MFDDKRSKKVIIAAHCILNQNARIEGCGYFPGAILPVARVLMESGVGILQMPCPELLFHGLDRCGNQGREIGIRETLLGPKGQQACKGMLKDLIYQINEYQKNGFIILGIVGIDGSPACGVNITWDHQTKGEITGTGGYIKAVKDVLADNNLGDIEIVGVKDHEWDAGIEKIKKMIQIK